MRKTYCNPLDLGYRYQHTREGEKRKAFREGADPTLVRFKGRYYLFVSMSAGFWYSDDLLDWQFHAEPDLLIQDYAPDVRAIGDYLYFCASRRAQNCPILRTKDPLNAPFEEVSAPFPFWDPDLFLDDDGRVYLYWGCSNTDPIQGVELNPETMLPLGEAVPLVFDHADRFGYERIGENGKFEKETSVVYRQLLPLFDPETQQIRIPAGMPTGAYDGEALTRIFLAVGRPYIEGAFMTKHDGRYYLQYACPGTEYNTYSDGVYVGDGPLGPFAPQASNPFSSVPGGFTQGAGHGSTIADRFGNYWHTATIRISVNHDFERRVGLYPAGFDADGVLYCNQNFADYPHRIPQECFDAAALQPEWMLLSYGKTARASSTAEGSTPANAVDERNRTWWSAGSAAPGEWLEVDLGGGRDVRAVQVNLADENFDAGIPEEWYGGERRDRYIELRPQITNLTVSVSADGAAWETLSTVQRPCSNLYCEAADGLRVRYVRVTGGALPYGQALRISGLRVFGNGAGERPAQAQVTAERVSPMNALVRWAHIDGAQGCNVRYGCAPDKLYHSWLVYGADEVELTTLIAGQPCWVCVDSFNESGITAGNILPVAD